MNPSQKAGNSPIRSSRLSADICEANLKNEIGVKAFRNNVRLTYSLENNIILSISTDGISKNSIIDEKGYILNLTSICLFEDEGVLPYVIYGKRILNHLPGQILKYGEDIVLRAILINANNISREIIRKCLRIPDQTNLEELEYRNLFSVFTGREKTFKQFIQEKNTQFR